MQSMTQTPNTNSLQELDQTLQHHAQMIPRKMMNPTETFIAYGASAIVAQGTLTLLPSPDDKSEDKIEKDIVIKTVDTKERMEELMSEVRAYHRLGWLALDGAKHCGKMYDCVRGAYGVISDGNYNRLVFEKMDVCLFDILSSDSDGMCASDKILSTASKTVYVLLNIANGLDKIHEAGLVHCDLRPSNIMLNIDMERDRNVLAKVADFGTSDVIGTHFEEDYVNRRKKLVHLTDDIIATPALDIKGLGVMIMELMSGRPINYQRELVAVNKAMRADVLHYTRCHHDLIQGKSCQKVKRRGRDEQPEENTTTKLQQQQEEEHARGGNNKKRICVETGEEGEEKTRMGVVVMRDFRDRPYSSQCTSRLRKAFQNDILCTKELLELAEGCVHVDPGQRPGLEKLKDGLQLALALCWY